VAFFVPALDFIPDPEGVTSLVDAVNKVYDLNVDTEKRVNKAEEIKQKLKQVAERHRKLSVDEERRGEAQTYVS
jgi:uncharacterized protein